MDAVRLEDTPTSMSSSSIREHREMRRQVRSRSRSCSRSRSRSRSRSPVRRAKPAMASSPAAAEHAKKLAQLKKLCAKFPMPSCESAAHHMLKPLTFLDSKRKPLAKIVEGANPVIIAAVQRTKLPPVLADLKAQYHTFGKRNPFLWQWLFYSTQLMAGSTIAAEYKEDVTLLKSLINMFNVVTDDIGDEDNDIQLLHKIEADLFASVDSEAKAVDFGSDDPQFKFCHELATRIWATARKLPRFTELAEILEYDIRQMLNEKRYSALTNKNPDMINKTEHSLVAPHTMHAMIFLTCDLMASPDVSRRELGLLRSMYWDANVMANLANCLGTWTREIPKRDWSSPLFPQAISDGLLTIKDLDSLPAEDVESRIRESDVEAKLLGRWFQHYDHIMSLDKAVTCCSAAEFAEKNVAFLAMHLACRGFI